MPTQQPINAAACQPYHLYLLHLCQSIYLDVQLLTPLLRTYPYVQLPTAAGSLSVCMHACVRLSNVLCGTTCPFLLYTC
jgi:hypothetical protein